MLQAVVQELARKTHAENAPLWRDIAQRLACSASSRAQVNLSRIERHTQKGDLVAVPGKVLGSGKISHPVTIGAFNFSKNAAAKVSAAGGKCISLLELSKLASKGTNVKILE